MDIEVEVLISYENKTLRVLLTVDSQEWAFCPTDTVERAIKAHGVDITSISRGKDVRCDWGEFVVDMTESLDASVLAPSAAWMSYGISDKDSGDPVDLMLTELYRSFPVLQSGEYECPHCQNMQLISNLIPHLNDHHDYSREEIADWLEATDLDIGISYEHI